MSFLFKTIEVIPGCYLRGVNNNNRILFLVKVDYSSQFLSLFGENYPFIFYCILFPDVSGIGAEKFARSKWNFFTGKLFS